VSKGMDNVTPFVLRIGRVAMRGAGGDKVGPCWSGGGTAE